MRLARQVLASRAAEAETTALLVLSDGQSDDELEVFQDRHVVAFGYGADHDAAQLQAIGTAGYTFIEHDDGFAQAVAANIAPIIDVAITDICVELAAAGGATAGIREKGHTGARSVRLGALAYESRKNL